MKQKKPDSLPLSRGESGAIPIELFLESFPFGAALIRPDNSVLQVNSYLEKIVGTTGSKLCYEALAGLHSICPFCPFEDLVHGRSGPIEAQVHNRRGREFSVQVRFVPDVGANGLMLELIADHTQEPSCLDLREKSDPTPHNSLNKLTGLLSVSRDLMGSAPLREKMSHVLNHLRSSLSDPGGSFVWLEIDNHVYGGRPNEIHGHLYVQEIMVEGKSRGRLSANCPGEQTALAEKEYFLEEAADLISRQVEISDLEAMLRQSEERYKKLALNLKKEMWTRTEALAKETVYLEGILRSSEDMIVTTDLNSRIVEFNHGAEKILGYTAEEMQGRKIGDIWLDPDEREQIQQEINVSGGLRNYETKLMAKNGDIREISLTLSLLKDEEGHTLGTVGVSKDISKENAVRRELERLNENYRETINFISHETKNSLIVIAGFVARLLVRETDPVRKDQLNIIYHHAIFLEAMSRDFLVMAEIEHGGFQVREESIENFYEHVILPAMIGIKERYPESFQSYDESMGGVGAIQLKGSPSLLEIVYRNLFGNALKYRHPNGKIAYGVVEQTDCYIFNVWNEGPGVSPDQATKIFDKFYRVHDETTREKRGTGLGLYNIRKIIEAHGGRIWCETKPGEWINFLFSLPKP